jgi:hypothetical protein
MQQSFPIKRRRSASEIRELVVRFRQSGLSRADFVRNEGLCLATLASYLKRVSTSASRACRSGLPAFLELDPDTLRPLRGSQQATYRLCLTGGLALEVHPGFSREEVEVLLSVLAEARFQ